MKRQRYALPLSMGLFGAALCSATPSWADSGHGHGPVRISGLSPYGALTNCGNFPGVVVTPGVNYVNTEIEPWVEVNPTNHDNIVAFWQQDRWSNGGSRGLVAGVSGDGGETWQSVVVPGLTDCSGGTYERATDPWLSFSPDGTLHQISLAFDIDPPPDVPNLNGPNALLVSKSSDGGLHWSEPISIFEDTDPNFFSDKQSITADPTDSNFVYAVWDRLEALDPDFNEFKGPTFFARSSDGGDTWEPARMVYDPGRNNQTIGNQIVVFGARRFPILINFFNEIINFTPSGDVEPEPFNLALQFSLDRGRNWFPQRPIHAAKILTSGINKPGNNATETPDEHLPVRDAGILFDVAVDPRTRVLYAVWQDARFNGGAFDSIAFSLSRTGGLTWSRPIKINQTPTGITPLRQQAFIPSVAVNDDGGVVVTYYDFRNDDDHAELTDFFAVKCVERCADPRHWGNERRLSSVSFDMRQAPVAGGFFLGDYMGLARAGDDFVTVFGQTTNDPNDRTNLFFQRIRD